MGLDESMQATGASQMTPQASKQGKLQDKISQTAYSSDSAANVALSEDGDVGVGLLKKFMDNAGSAHGFSASKFENKVLDQLKRDYSQLAGQQESSEDAVTLSQDSGLYQTNLQNLVQKKLQDKQLSQAKAKEGSEDTESATEKGATGGAAQAAGMQKQQKAQKGADGKQDYGQGQQEEEAPDRAGAKAATTGAAQMAGLKSQKKTQRETSSDSGRQGEKETAEADRTGQKSVTTGAQTEAALKQKKMQKDNLKQEAFQRGELGRKLGERGEIQSQAASVYGDRRTEEKRQKEAGQYGTAGGSAKEEKEVLANQYKAAFSAYLGSKSTVAAAKMADIERQMKLKGFSQKEITALQQEVKKQFRSALVAEVQGSLTEAIIGQDDVLSKFQTKASLNSVLNYISNNDKLGGKDFGNYQEGLQNLVNTTSADVKDDLRQMAKDEYFKYMNREALMGQKKGELSLKAIQDLATKSGSMFSVWADKYARPIKDQLGLNQDDNLPQQKEGELVDTSADGQGQNNARGGRDQRSQEEKEEDQKNNLLIGRMRALYMQQLLNPGSVRQKVKTYFEMRKTKGDMVATGIFSEALDMTIREEAKILAFEQNLEMLFDAFMERATVFDMKGRASQLVDKKILSIMAVAKQIGQEVDSETFNKIRDEANKQIFAQCKKELQDTELALQARTNKALLDKKRKLISIMERLKEESKIDEEIKTVVSHTSQFVVEDA